MADNNIVGNNLARATGLNKIWQQVYDDTEKALRVIASLKLEAVDLQIGAVEIKDSDSDNRLVINPDGSLNVNISSSSSVSTADFSTDDTGTGLVNLTGLEDVVLSIPVPNGSIYNISSWDWLANAPNACIVRLKIMNGASLTRLVRIKKSITGEKETEHIHFEYPITVIGGDNVELVCTVEKINGQSDGVASAGINGYFL